MGRQLLKSYNLEKLNLRFMKNLLLLLTGFLIAAGALAQDIASLYAVKDENTVRPVYSDSEPVCNCEELMQLSLPDTKIESAVFRPADSTCMITATVNHPPSRDKVTVTLALPVKNWNGRFYGMGGGGFLTGIPLFLGIPASQGFAAAVTDGGHEGGSGSFALDTKQGRLRWQEIRDFAYQGIHDMTVVGKAVILAFFGKPAGYSYFVGGSTGGRQAMMEAQRFPEDYDGILAYFPAINWSRLLLADMWPQAVMNDEGNFVSKDKLDAVTRAVTEAADGNDGVVDGVIDYPLSCTWDPKEFTGREVGDEIFTEADANVVRRIWEGPRTCDGKFLWYGLTRGANLTQLSGTKGSPLTAAPFDISMDWIRYFLVLNPGWDIKSLTWAEFEQLFNQSVDQYTDVIGTDDTDLSQFRDHGGKLIIMHGLADQLIPPQGTIEYFNKMNQRMGGINATSRFARLYLVPGVDHSLIGAGPKPVGQFDALIRWVEEGKAPYRIIAELKDKEGNIIRTRPLFPYPSIAVYSGKGNSDKAENYNPELPDHR
jgi:pimeloyl-ACP methyl ester carboxylesterase